MAVECNGIFANDQEIDQLKEDELIDQESGEEGANKDQQLVKDCDEAGNGQNLGGNQREDSHWRAP